MMVFPVWQDGFFQSSLDPSIFPGQNLYITVLWHLWIGCFVSPLYRSGHSSLHWLDCIGYVTLCLGVLSSGWTSFCLRVLECLKCTGMFCLLKILLKFSESPATYGLTMLFHFFGQFFCVSSGVSRGFDEGPARVSPSFEGCPLLPPFPLFWRAHSGLGGVRFWLHLACVPGGWWESKRRYWSVWLGFL